jgi:hypothetical protein
MSLTEHWALDLYGNGLFGFELGMEDLIICSFEVFFMLDPTMRWKNFRVKNGFMDSCVK